MKNVTGIQGSTYVLAMTDGKQIIYGQKSATAGSVVYGDYATQIQDANSNTIRIYYNSTNRTMIDHVVDSVGRTISFTTAAAVSGGGPIKLKRIVGPGIDIDYNYKVYTTPSSGSYYFLNEVTPPDGGSWKYDYDPTMIDLVEMTTPYSGIIEYSYDFNYFGALIYRTVTEKRTSGPGVDKPGKWTFAYSQNFNSSDTNHGTTLVTEYPASSPTVPDRTIKHTFYGYGEPTSSVKAWQYGLPKSKAIIKGDRTIESENYSWVPSDKISDINYTVHNITDIGIFVPMKSTVVKKRDGHTYTTEYSTFDSYANPTRIKETGDNKRTTDIAYWYKKSKNIVQGKIKTKTVSGDFPGSFTTSASYDNSTGNPLAITHNGVKTTYTYTNGNLRTEQNARNKTTTYDWAYGRAANATNSIYKIKRVINSDGTVKSVTDGNGHKTSYTYDLIQRLTKIHPPIGDNTTITYSDTDHTMTQTKAAFVIRKKYDGFMRLVNVRDSTGANTTTAYRANGLKDFTDCSVGERVRFDDFGRPVKITHKDEKQIQFSYNATTSTTSRVITDEMSRKTYNYFTAFGDPDEKLLTRVTDANQISTDYSYNILGSLRTIMQGTLTLATYNYDSTTNFLTSESHPQTGSVTYKRDAVGNIIQTIDVTTGTTNYAYDALNRLSNSTRTDGLKIKYAYDKANNRISMDSYNGTNLVSSFDYTYDSINRCNSTIMNFN
jgi:YD repeat-containing protein